jgi:hypothetical protein
MACVWPVDKGFFPLDEELAILPGKLTPREHECLVRLSGWMPFGRAVELLGDFLGIQVSQIVAQNCTETAGAMYVQMQEEEVARLEGEMPEAVRGADKIQISADGAMVPLLHGIWAEVRTLVVGEVQPAVEEKGEQVVHTQNLSYFSRKVTAQEFGRLALVEMHRRGVEQAKQVAAVMDGADWEQGFVDFHCPGAIRILDFAHAAEHLNQIGEYVHGEHTPESQAWLKDHAHSLKHEGPDALLQELEELQKQYPQTEAIASNLAYLKKRKQQIQYPLFQALGWPIGSGIVESGNKLVVQARLKGAGMHWAEPNVNPMLALRNILCSGRWREDWPKIEGRLRLLARQRRQWVHRKHHPAPLTSLVARALQGEFDLAAAPLPSQPTSSSTPRKNPWRNFTYGKALFQRHPKI